MLGPTQETEQLIFGDNESLPLAGDSFDSVVRWTEADDKNTDANAVESRTEKPGINEPDDLFVVLARDSVLESTRTSWTPEMDYGMEMYIADVDKRNNSVEMKDQTEDNAPANGKTTNIKKISCPTTKKPAKDASPKLLQGSFAKNKKTQPGSRLMSQKSKLETEEVNR